MKSMLCFHGSAIRRFWLALGMLTLVAIYLAACVPPSPPPASPSPIKECVDFEGLMVGTVHKVPNTFVDSGTTIQVLPFQWGTGGWTSDGQADVTKNGLAGGEGNEMFLNNVNLGFDVGSLECVTIRFRDQGGNVNLVINNDMGNFADFQHASVGGVNVSVAYGAGGNNTGTLTLSGRFDKFNFQEKGMISFTIGGQELSIDDVCPCR